MIRTSLTAAHTGRRAFVAAIGALSLVVGLGACSSSSPQPSLASASSTETSAPGSAALNSRLCEVPPAPDGMGCERAQTLVSQMAAGLKGGLTSAVTSCLVDKLQDVPETPISTLGAIYDCESFRVLGKLQHTALGLSGDDKQIDCLAGAIQGTGHDEFLAAINAGAQSEVARTLAKDYRDQCATS